MHIAVLAKVVPDYEVPARDFELAGNRAHSRYTRMIGLYDENAIETGIQLKEKYGAKLSIVSYGHGDDVPILRKAIAMGGDTLHLILGDSDDPYVIAANLKMALEQIKDIDLVLAGQQSADLDRGIVHGILAEMLGYTFLAQISKIEFDQDRWTVQQNHENGSRMLQFGRKAVLSITSSHENVPRIPVVRAIMAAKKKPVEKLQGIDAVPMKAEEINVEIPKLESMCEFLPLDDLQQTAKILLARLREERYL
ncbi:MAG: electron transfer flavoprotein subunit beta/FixA family protein [Deltaproteobacteria bacterium]|nr:electron transfer flavoprotein subunit beta/FixA family protein [Deltaproteobacteria bacterium]